jgi:hypothetical protein
VSRLQPDRQAASSRRREEGPAAACWAASLERPAARQTLHSLPVPRRCRCIAAAKTNPNLAAAVPVCRTRTAFRDLNPQYGEFFEVGNLPAAAGQSQDQASADGVGEAAGAAGRGTEDSKTGAGAEGAAGAGQGAKLRVEVWDKDLLTPDDVIGAAEWVFAPQQVSTTFGLRQCQCGDSSGAV